MDNMEEKSTIKIAEVIARQRREHNMTQKELGDTLHISPQAVSKWEKGLAEPDIDTLLKMCEIFGITMNEMCGQAPEEDEEETDEESEDAPEEAEEAAATAQAQPAPKSADEPPAPATPVVILGYCEQCKKPLHSLNEYETQTETHRVGRHTKRRTKTVCKSCAQKERESRSRAEYYAFDHETKKSFIIGGIAGAAALIIFLIAVLKSSDNGSIGAAIGGTIIISLAVFAFFTQIFWEDSHVSDIFFFFLKSFKMPGVIFSLSFDGLKFLIFAKILFLVIGALASVLFFLLGLIVTPIISLFIFPFALPLRLAKGKRLKAAATAVKNK